MRTSTETSTRLSELKDALASISALRKTEPARLSKLIRGDLDWIVMKALDKDRTRRYETANGLANNLQRHLDGDPVEASPPSTRYRLRKFARKHRVALVTTVAFGLLLLSTSAVSVGLAISANRERVRAAEERARAVVAENSAKEQRDIARDREESANTERARAVIAEALARQQQTRAEDGSRPPSTPSGGSPT